MLTKTFPQFPQTKVQISLFDNVSNGAEIRKALLAGNQDFAYAFVAAPTIVSLEHLLAAIYRALNERDQGTMRTKTIHSEVVYCLSPNNNIMDGLKRFGIADDTKSLFAIKIIDDHENAEKYAQFLKQNVAGDELEVADSAISKLTDEAVIKKNYKLPAKANLIIPAISLRGF